VREVFLHTFIDTLDKSYYDKMHQRPQSSYARKMKQLRQSTVEPVLGTLTNFLTLKRVNTNKTRQQMHAHVHHRLQHQESTQVQG
ncbi:MAG TPA: hypothetical protein VFW11_06400, partial [Cyclobacteriaceae bacterium]|nr:hypothetical protein [Cyclobacteriaceae bacterium]